VEADSENKDDAQWCTEWMPGAISLKLVVGVNGTNVVEDSYRNEQEERRTRQLNVAKEELSVLFVREVFGG